MAKIADINEETWREWVASKPAVVQEMCAIVPPDRLYRMKDSGHRVTVVSYSENRTVTVAVSGRFNCLAFERQVFGIKPEELEECDIPTDEEPVGAMLTEREDVKAFIDGMKEQTHA